MSPTAQLIQTQINQFIRGYVPDYSNNLNLNRILNLILQLADSGGTSGSGTLGEALRITSANFSNTTDCPLPALNGVDIGIYYGEGGKFLELDLGEWSVLTGGGFKVTIPNFDSTLQVYHFYIFELSN